MATVWYMATVCMYVKLMVTANTVLWHIEVCVESNHISHWVHRLTSAYRLS